LSKPHRQHKLTEEREEEEEEWKPPVQFTYSQISWLIILIKLSVIM